MIPNLSATSPLAKVQHLLKRTLLMVSATLTLMATASSQRVRRGRVLMAWCLPVR
nr:MAG TPA: hypothetical protein [Myoviridae sp. cttWQ44]